MEPVATRKQFNKDKNLNITGKKNLAHKYRHVFEFYYYNTAE